MRYPVVIRICAQETINAPMGKCKGTPFTCLSCESCNGYGCSVKPGFCVIDRRCYSHGALRPGKPCQVCLGFIAVFSISLFNSLKQ